MIRVSPAAAGKLQSSESTNPTSNSWEDRMKTFSAAVLLSLMILSIFSPQAMAANTAKQGKITGKTVVAGATSLLIWPGVGQYLNDNEVKKNWTHAILGITQIFRFWSGWDALVDRQGGRWDGKI